MKTFLSKIQRDKWPLAGLLAGSGVLAWMMELDLRSLGVPLAMFCVLALAILTYWVQECLPVRIYAGKKQGTLAWKFITARLVCELALFFLAFVYYAWWVGKIYFVVTQILLWGFVCAAANATGLWKGIQTVCTRYILWLVCAAVGIWVLRYVGQKIFVFPGGAFVQGFWMAAVFIAAIYVVMPRLSVQK